MADPTIWSAPPHTLAKHEILKQYLLAWLPIMLRKFPNVVFIDGFAGPGVYTGHEPGSPVIELTITAEHQRLRAIPPQHGIYFVFIEEREDRFQCLQLQITNLLQKIQLPSWITQKAIHGTFETESAHILADLKQKGHFESPRFVFADPFGYGDIPMRTLADLMEAPSSEVLIFFDYNEIYRFLADPSKANALDRLYLTQEWREYVDELDPTQQRKGLLDLYARELRTHAHFNYVWPFELVNVQHHHYFLVFGTRVDEGLRRMKHAYWKVDPERGRYFVDPQNPHQASLFPATSDPNQLPEILRNQFKGQPVPIEEVERFVLRRTDFVDDSHLKTRALKKMEQTSPPQIEVTGRKRKRPGEYPAGTHIRFF